MKEFGKRSLSVLIILLLLVSMVPAMMVSAQTTLGANIVSNGDFELGQTGWGFRDVWASGPDNTDLPYITSDATHGNFVQSDNSCATASQTINLESGQVAYQIDFDYKAAGTNQLAAEIQFYDTIDKKWVSLWGVNAPASSTWTSYSGTIVCSGQNQGGSATLLFYNKGENRQAAVDNISLRKIEGYEVPDPEMAVLSTNWVFFYPDFDEGKADITIHRYFSARNYTVDFKIQKGEQILLQSEKKQFVDLKASFEFDPKIMTEKKTEYLVIATIYSGTETVKEYTQPIYVYDRPTDMNEKGQFIHKGEVVNPMFGYQVPKNTWDALSKAGVNVVMFVGESTTEKTLEALDTLYEKGLFAAVVCFWSMYPAGHPENVQRVGDFVRSIKHHPAIFCWMIVDEPWATAPKDIPVDKQLHDSYKLIRDIDDAHPVHIVDASPDKYRESAKYCDVLMIDPYPGNGNDYGRFVGECNIKACEAVEYEKPVYNLLQAFTFVTKPQPHQLRQMLYQSFLGGAQGSGYYSISPDNPYIDKTLTRSEFWPIIQGFHDLESEIVFSHFSSIGDKPFNKESTQNIWYESWMYGDNLYVAVINRDISEQTVTIPLVSTDKKTKITEYDISVVNGGEISAVAKGEEKFTVALTSHQAVLYEIVPKAIVEDFYTLSENLIINGDFEAEDDSNWDVFNVWDRETPENQPAIVTEGGNSYFKSTVACGYLSDEVWGIDTSEEDVAYMLEFDYQLAENTRSTVDVLYSHEGWVYTTIPSGDLPASPDKWTHYQNIVVLGSEAGARKGTALLRFYNQGGNMFKVDNISVKKVGGYDTDNPVLNPSFELGASDAAFSWNYHTLGEESTRPHRTDAQASNGKNSVHQAGWGGQVYTDVAFPKGTTGTYLLQYDYKQTEAGHIWCNVYDNAAAPVTYVDRLDKAVSDDWTRAGHVIRLDNFEGTSVRIVLTGRASATGEFYVDNVSLKPVTETSLQVVNVRDKEFVSLPERETNLVVKAAYLSSDDLAGARLIVAEFETVNGLPKLTWAKTAALPADSGAEIKISKARAEEGKEIRIYIIKNNLEVIKSITLK